MPGIKAGNKRDLIIPLDEDEVIEYYFHSLFTHFNRPAPPPETLLKLKFEELLVHVLSAHRHRPLHPFMSEICHSARPSIPDIMEANFTKNLSLNEFARLCGRSLSSFKTGFKKIYHTSPGRWLRGKRLDYADNILTPNKGHLIELSGFFYSALFQSNFSYNKFISDIRKYLKVDNSNKHILAFQALMEFSFGDVPFEELGMICGENIMRGYMEGRFRDENCIQTQMEYRRNISGRIGIVAFGALGNVMPGLKNIDPENTVWTLGVGIRYNINKADLTFIRLDYGLGKNTSGFYMTFGEAF